MLPSLIKPMLATMTEPFDSTDYTFEIKWDGYRCLAFLDGSTRLQSRNLKDLSSFFPELRHLHKIGHSGSVLDGELIALRDDKPSFMELQKRGQLRNPEQIQIATHRIPVVYAVFDILYFNERPLLHETIENRRSILEEHFNGMPELIVTQCIPDQGLKFYQTISAMQLEGVVAKKKASLYLPGKRNKTWLKFKRKLLDNFIICGYLLHSTSRGEIRSLILGSYREGKLRLFGMVGTGFTVEELHQIYRHLSEIATEICPFTGAPAKQKNVVWTRPLVVCEVEYLELTDDGSLRHPSFKRFRPDLRPEDCQFGEA